MYVGVCVCVCVIFNLNWFLCVCGSFSDEAGGAIKSDVVSLSIGYFIVILFVMIVLGRFNCMEQKVSIVRLFVALFVFAIVPLFVFLLHRVPSCCIVRLCACSLFVSLLHCSSSCLFTVRLLVALFVVVLVQCLSSRCIVLLRTCSLFVLSLIHI